MFGTMLGGFRATEGDTVTCSAGDDTRARRGDTQLPAERGWYSIDVGRGGAGGPRRAGAKAPGAPAPRAEREALVRGGSSGRDQYTHAQTRKDKVISKD
jgi:hypothetical protein